MKCCTWIWPPRITLDVTGDVVPMILCCLRPGPAIFKSRNDTFHALAPSPWCPQLPSWCFGLCRGKRERKKINRNFLGTRQFCKCSEKEGGIKSTHKEPRKKFHSLLTYQEVRSLFYCHLWELRHGNWIKLHGIWSIWEEMVYKVSVRMLIPSIVVYSLLCLWHHNVLTAKTTTTKTHTHAKILLSVSWVQQCAHLPWWGHRAHLLENKWLHTVL